MAKVAKDVIAAVEAARVYYGCDGRVSIKDAQKLYNTMNKKIDGVAKCRGMDRQSAADQISKAAQDAGPVCPIPGKHI